jgi:hypothetical protein
MTQKPIIVADKIGKSYGDVDGKPLSQEAVSVIDLQSVTPSPNETEDADKTKSAVVSFPTKR